MSMKRADRVGSHSSDRESSPGRSSRDKILHAAVQVAIRDGIIAMTLDAVAAEAGVSKGGLLYHFRSKDELIAAMLVHFREEMQGQLEKRMADDPNPRGRFVRAMVQTVFPRDRQRSAAGTGRSQRSRLFMAILTAAVNNPSLLDPICQSAKQVRQRMLAESPNGLRQIAVRAAIDGLVLWEHLGIISSDDPLHESILNELLTLAEGPDPSVSKE
jgi:AcrR family transcriptional regulator